MEEGDSGDRTRDSSGRTEPGRAGGGGHKPKSTASLQKLEMVGKGFSTQASRRKAALSTP